MLMYYSIPKDTLASRDQGEFVLMNMKTGKFYGLDLTGSEIWSLLEEGKSIPVIVEQLCFRYQELSQERALADVNGLITQLLQAKLILEKQR